MFDITALLNPPTGLSVTEVLSMAFILGMLHGATPDEHTWPITFSYAIGSYSTKGGMKAGLLFSLGFMSQRAILTTLGFLGLAAIYKAYNLDGPVYILVGLAMFIAGSYLLKGKYLHLPIDVFLRGKHHHTTNAERIPLPEADMKPIPLKMATSHGFIAGWGFGAYATIITFVLSPQLPSLIYAPFVGLIFGIGTMCMQIIFGAIFANIMRVKKLTENQIKHLGKTTASRTLYYGGLLFAAMGVLMIIFTHINDFGISTGNPIPNIDSIGIPFVLVVGVVGGIGLSSMIQGYREIARKKNFGTPGV